MYITYVLRNDSDLAPSHGLQLALGFQQHRGWWLLDEGSLDCPLTEPNIQSVEKTCRNLPLSNTYFKRMAQLRRVDPNCSSQRETWALRTRCRLWIIALHPEKTAANALLLQHSKYHEQIFESNRKIKKMPLGLIVPKVHGDEAENLPSPWDNFSRFQHHLFQFVDKGTFLNQSYTMQDAGTLRQLQTNLKKVWPIAEKKKSLWPTCRFQTIQNIKSSFGGLYLKALSSHSWRSSC